MDDKAERQWGIAPLFLVGDVVATANFYRDKLGFGYERFWGDPPAFCMVKRAGIVIMLSQVGVAGAGHPNELGAPGTEPWDAYIWVDDVDALYSEFQGRSVEIARDICDQPYGVRDFDVLDCNGYRLCFGEPIAGE